jgi:hypothetical protein
MPCEGDQRAQFGFRANAGANVKPQSRVGPQAVAPLKARGGDRNAGREFGRDHGVTAQRQRIGYVIKGKHLAALLGWRKPDEAVAADLRQGPDENFI